MNRKFLLLLTLIVMYIVISFILKLWIGYIAPKAAEAADNGLIAMMGFWGCMFFGFWIGYKIVQRFKNNNKKG
jgi:hypothetical protein